MPVEGQSSDDDEPLAGPPVERPAVPDAPRRPRPRTAAEHARIRYYVVWNVAGAREENRGGHEGSIAAWRYLERQFPAGRYSRGFHLRRAATLEAAIELYYAEAVRQEAPTPPNLYRHQ